MSIVTPLTQPLPKAEETKKPEWNSSESRRRRTLIDKAEVFKRRNDIRTQILRQIVDIQPVPLADVFAGDNLADSLGKIVNKNNVNDFSVVSRLGRERDERFLIQHFDVYAHFLLSLASRVVLQTQIEIFDSAAAEFPKTRIPVFVDQHLAIFHNDRSGRNDDRHTNKLTHAVKNTSYHLSCLYMFKYLMPICLTSILFGAGCAKPQVLTINNFEDCAKYYPVMESYPEQCRTPDGRLFVRPLSDEEEEKTKPPENLELSTMGALAGKVTVGPICPVERIDQPCPVPPEAYTSRELIIYKVDGKTFVTSTHFKSDGTYSITLPPSNYVADVSRTGTFGSSKDTPHAFRIYSSVTTTFDLSIDTGIR